MLDPYPYAMNAAFSNIYATKVDVNFGDSGCDDCDGSSYDISSRIESTRDRARLKGQWRTKPAWIVPQSFDGTAEFWLRIPTGGENLINNLLAWNHGGQGSVAWNSMYSSKSLLGVSPETCIRSLSARPTRLASQTQVDLSQNSSDVAHLVNSQKRFLIDAYDSRKQILSNLSYPGINGVDLASWSIPNSNGTGKTETLIFIVNQLYGGNDSGDSYRNIFSLANYTGRVKSVLYGNVTSSGDGGPIFTMPRTSIAAVILEM